MLWLYTLNGTGTNNVQQADPSSQIGSLKLLHTCTELLEISWPSVVRTQCWSERLKALWEHSPIQWGRVAVSMRWTHNWKITEEHKCLRMKNGATHRANFKKWSRESEVLIHEGDTWSLQWHEPALWPDPGPSLLGSHVWSKLWRARWQPRPHATPPSIYRRENDGCARPPLNKTGIRSVTQQVMVRVVDTCV